MAARPMARMTISPAAPRGWARQKAMIATGRRGSAVLLAVAIDIVIAPSLSCVPDAWVEDAVEQVHQKVHCHENCRKQHDKRLD